MGSSLFLRGSCQGAVGPGDAVCFLCRHDGKDQSGLAQRADVPKGYQTKGINSWGSSTAGVVVLEITFIMKALSWSVIIRTETLVLISLEASYRSQKELIKGGHWRGCTLDGRSYVPEYGS